MSPACIRASLLQSLERMRLTTVDLLYLHNPAEMQLGHLGKGNFTLKLKEAFREMEKLKQEGLIIGYGLATWDCFRAPPTSPQVGGWDVLWLLSFLHI
jgi:aryl-alcohol dehydrogenase-like predicted oxidoreductase